MVMNWNFDELKSFGVLARELHFHRAAEQLLLSQPALSKQIRRLEEKVGGRLFERTRRKVTLTETGRVLLPLAEGILRQSNAAFAIAKEASTGTAGILHVGYGLAVVHDFLPRAMVRFRGMYPHVQLQLRDMSTPAQLAALLEEKMDIGFVRLPVSSPELDCLPVIEERLVLAVPESFPGKRKLADVKDTPFVLLSRAASATFYDHALTLCHQAGFSPNIVQEASDTFTILNFVRAGLGVSLVQSAASRMKVPGIRYHDLRVPEAVWKIGLAWKRDGERYDLSQKFVKAVRTRAKACIVSKTKGLRGSSSARRTANSGSR